MPRRDVASASQVAKMPVMPNAIRVHANGGPEALRWESVPSPSAAPGQVVVRHEAIGVNFIDVYHRTGLYPLALPTGLGMEAAGIIDAVGDGVTQFKVGDRVAYFGGPPDGYSEVRAIAADRVIALGDDIDSATAAAMLLKGMTVEMLVRRVYPVQSGQTVLVHAAAGGVGLIACQWLKHLGATVIGTVGSDEKAALAREHGCEHPVVYTRESFKDRVRDITDGQGVAVVYDSVGKSTFMDSLDCLQPRGMLVGFGNASGKPDPLDISLLATKGSLYVTRATLLTYAAQRDDLVAAARALFEVVRSGAVRVDVRQKWSLSEAAEAHRALEARQTTGATILLP